MCRIIGADVLHIACGHVEKKAYEVAFCHHLSRTSDSDPEACPFLLKRERHLDAWREGSCDDCNKANEDLWPEHPSYHYCPKKVIRRLHTLCGHTQLIYTNFGDCVHTLVPDTDAEGQPRLRRACPLRTEVVDLDDTTILCLQCKRDCDTIGFELEREGLITNIDDEMKYPHESNATGIPEVYAEPGDTTISFAPGVFDPYEIPVHRNPHHDIDAESNSSSDGGDDMFDHDDNVQREPDDDEEVLETRLGMVLGLRFDRNNTFQLHGINGNLQYDDADQDIDFEAEFNDDFEDIFDDFDESDDLDEFEDIMGNGAVQQQNVQVQPAVQPNTQTDQEWIDVNESQTEQLSEEEMRMAGYAIICQTHVTMSGDFVLGDWVRQIIVNGRMSEEYILESLEHIVNLDMPVTIEAVGTALDSLRDAINRADRVIQRQIEATPKDAPGFSFTQRATYLDRIEEVKAMLPRLVGQIFMD